LKQKKNKKKLKFFKNTFKTQKQTWLSQAKCLAHQEMARAQAIYFFRLIRQMTCHPPHFFLEKDK
jgi:hypothetical protein